MWTQETKKHGELDVAGFLIDIGFTIPQMIECLRHLENGVCFSESMKRALNSEGEKSFCEYGIDPSQC